MALLPGTVLAAGGDETSVKEAPTGVTTDANNFTTVLDNLRAMGRAEVRLAAAESARNAAVFNHSSDMTRLHEQAIQAQNRPVIASASDFISHLDQLRQTAQSALLTNEALALTH
jgi:hypothetical protein